MSKPADLPNDIEALKALLAASEGRNLRKQDRISLKEPTPAVLDRMAECAIHLSASTVESFGLTLAEALAVGCPVVAREHPGSRFLLSDGRGVIAEDKSVGSLAAALRQTMADVENKNPDLQTQIELGQRFVAELTPDHIGQQWRRAIIDLVDAKFN